MSASKTVWVAPMLVLAGLGMEIQAQERESGASASGAPVVPGCCDTGVAPVLTAMRVDDADISIDGAMDEAAWRAAAVATRFTQFEPDEGLPATQSTEARVLYGASALFVFMRANDTSPGEIASQVTRRDQQSYSDLLAVVIDSYFDRRTAFQFVVNPAGVKQDVYRFDDTNEDAGWDAVWDVATARDAGGWSAEFRIPYSQLRFRDREEQTWGINFLRHLARRAELSVWAPTTRADGGIVSQFGELRGLRNLDPPRRLEVLPLLAGQPAARPRRRGQPLLPPQRRGGIGGCRPQVRFDLRHHHRPDHQPGLRAGRGGPGPGEPDRVRDVLPGAPPVLPGGRGHLQFRHRIGGW